MQTDKPSIFFSHSSHDQRPLSKLKKIFCSKTENSIDVFLSSDGQSLPFGRNWVSSLEQALDRAKLMLVFVTPSSLHSNWLYFEAGYGYRKGIQVVPIGLFGVDLSAVAVLNHLQGFNVDCEAGLNNIVAIANEACGQSYPEVFTSADFQVISAAAGARNSGVLGRHATALDQLFLSLEKDTLTARDPVASLRKLAIVLAADETRLDEARNTVDLLGVRFSLGALHDVQVEVDLRAADVLLPVVETAVRAVRSNGLAGLELRFDFSDGLVFVNERHKVTGRLRGRGVSFGQEYFLHYCNFDFKLDRLRIATASGATENGRYVLRIRLLEDVLPLGDIGDLLDLLFESKVVFDG